MKYISIHNKLWNKNSILHHSKKATQFQVRIKICNIRLGKSTRGLPGRYGTIRILSECPAQPSIITFRFAGKQNLKTILFLQQVAPKATQGSFQVTAGNLQLPGEPRAAPQHLDKISFEVLGLTQTVDSNSSLYNSKINTLAVFPGVYTVSRLGPKIDIKFENKIVSRWGRSVGPHLPSRLEKRDTQKKLSSFLPRNSPESVIIEETAPGDRQPRGEPWVAPQSLEHIWNVGAYPVDRNSALRFKKRPPTSRGVYNK